MTWLALCDHTERRLSLRGLSIDKQDQPILKDHPESRLSRGTILFETKMSADAKPQLLFGYTNTHPEQRSLTFQAIPGGGIAMVQVQGKTINHAAIQFEDGGRTETLRVSYAWDSNYRWGRLTLEYPGQTHLSQSFIDTPCALTLDDIRDLMLGRTGQTFAPDMIFAALSDQIEPIGPMPSLHPDTPIATARGYRPVSNLQRGDTLYAKGAGIVPVLERIDRVVPARGSYRPVRLRAPYFGLQEDIIVAPDQRLKIDGPEVEYLFNQEAVLVSARHLVNGFAAMEEPAAPLVRYTQVLLPDHETLLAAGTALESLYVGRICRDNNKLQSSVLAGFDRSIMPEHRRPAHPVLQWHDAIHLARRRAA